MSKTDQIVEFMSRPSTYPDRPRSVEVTETHISWVFLTERFAFKLKKPVKFEFVDFSTPALRRQACLDELRLNRRLAPNVYLDVLRVSEDRDGSFRLGGEGREIDWVVHMRRLPAARAFDHVLLANQLAAKDAKRVAELLAEFYAGLAPQSVQPDDYRQALDRHIRANQASLLEMLPEEKLRLRRIHSAQLRYLYVNRPVFDDRVRAGRIVDGHGDLRPEHIYLECPPAIIDCIEFSEELRRVDTADELSFLAMECERIGHGDVGELVLSTYEQVGGDEIPQTFSAFYRCYRACVRAKVSLLQGRQQSDDRRRSMTRLAHEYVGWADHYAAELGRPCLIVVFGLMGSGKSTLAKKLSEAFDIDVISTDAIRRSILGTSTSPASYGEGQYRPEMRRQVYDELLKRASEILDKGQSVIVDGTFLTQQLRDRVNRLAGRHGAEAVDILCECPQRTVLARIKKRAASEDAESEARADLYEAQLREFQPPRAGEPIVRVDSTVDLSRQSEIVCDGLRELVYHRSIR